MKSTMIVLSSKESSSAFIKKLLMVLLLTFLALYFTACAAPSNHRTGPVNVLVIGDSISLGYTPYVTSNLKDQGYSVSHVPENSRNSAYTLKKIDSWLSVQDQLPDVITWNNGMWNCTYAQDSSYNTDDLFTSLDQYESDIRAIAIKLKATNARVIFFTTTWIPRPQGNFLNMDYEIQLNEVAKRVLPEYGVEVYDLFPLSKSLPDSMRRLGFDIHYTEEGYQVLSNFVSAAITGEQRGE